MAKSKSLAQELVDTVFQQLATSVTREVSRELNDILADKLGLPKTRRKRRTTKRKTRRRTTARRKSVRAKSTRKRTTTRSSAAKRKRN